MVVTFILALILLAIAVIDALTLRIPDLLSLPLIVAGLAIAGLAGPDILIASAVGALAAFVTFWAVGETYYRRRGVEGLGLGDAKLFAAAGAWLGWRGLPPVLLIAALGGIAFTLVIRTAPSDRRIPFGPFLAGGFFIVHIVRAA